MTNHVIYLEMFPDGSSQMAQVRSSWDLATYNGRELGQLIGIEGVHRVELHDSTIDFHFGRPADYDMLLAECLACLLRMKDLKDLDVIEFRIASHYRQGRRLKRVVELMEQM